MSDIGIRFDGLVLLATLAASGMAYSAVALIALIWRRPRMAGLAALMAVGALVVAGAFFVFLDKHGTAFTGPDLLDLNDPSAGPAGAHGLITTIGLLGHASAALAVGAVTT